MYIDCFPTASAAHGRGSPTTDGTDTRWIWTPGPTRSPVSMPISACCQRPVRSALFGASKLPTEPSSPTPSLYEEHAHRAPQPLRRDRRGPRSDCSTHLYTPIALGMPMADAAGRPQRQRLHRRCGAKPQAGRALLLLQHTSGYDYGCINRMFPFTPRELHQAGCWVRTYYHQQARPVRLGRHEQGRRVSLRCAGKETQLDLQPQTVGEANVWHIQLQPGEIVILERENNRGSFQSCARGCAWANRVSEPTRRAHADTLRLRFTATHLMAGHPALEPGRLPITVIQAAGASPAFLDKRDSEGQNPMFDGYALCGGRP